MLPAMEGDNWSKVTLRPLDRRKSLQKNWHLHHLESGGNDSSGGIMIVETVHELHEKIRRRRLSNDASNQNWMHCTQLCLPGVNKKLFVC